MPYTRKRFTNYQQYEIQKKVHTLHVHSGTIVRAYFEVPNGAPAGAAAPRSSIKTEKPTQFTWHDVDMSSRSGYEFVQICAKAARPHASSYTFELRINFEPPYPEVPANGPKYRVTHMFVELDRVHAMSKNGLVSLRELMDEIDVSMDKANWK